VTVISRAEEAPVIFAALNRNVPPFRPLTGQPFITVSWQSPTPDEGSSDFTDMDVDVRGFNTGGNAATGTSFAWHLTIECAFLFHIQG
jgi:hypothetical protein